MSAEYRRGWDDARRAIARHLDDRAEQVRTRPWKGLKAKIVDPALVVILRYAADCARRIEP